MSMMGTVDLGVFVCAGLILNITPGADMLYIASRSAAQGTKAGIIAALGIGAGCLAHILFATLGLSVILASSALAFAVVKYAGALYLVYLGIATLLSFKNKEQSTLAPIIDLSAAKIFRQAVLINVLNPKVALFFMALLPQFVSPQAAHPALSFLFLGSLFDFNGTIVNIIFAVFSSHIAAKFKQSLMIGRVCKTVVAGLFIALGVRLALTTQK
jgi:threonine/homoserine/homoserine lactone efflux protein